jgi:hypothetical protein
MSKQTAVDWLFLMINNPNDNQEMALKCLEKAKQIEKEQIMEAVYDSMGTNFDPNMGRAELYYKEKYGNGGHK